MSCGKTHTRRQAHNHRRQQVVKRHQVQKHKRIVIVQSINGPKKRRTVVKKRVKKRVQARGFIFSMKALKAWERKHPFKNNTFCQMKFRYARWTKAQMAAWDKTHPFKPFTQAQMEAWFKAHPFKN